MTAGMSRRQVLATALPVAAAGAAAAAGLGGPRMTAVSMVQGPDGNVWFADTSGNAIIKITTSTGAMTSYTTGLSADAGPVKIVVGPGTSPDLWFTEAAGKIGKITTGGVITEFPVVGAAVLVGLALGPDGNLWFCDLGRNAIGKAVLLGGAIVSVSLFTVPTAGALPRSITAGPAGDNTLWFTESMASKIGKITTGGTITEYTTTTAAALPWEIALGSDGNLWFTEGNANKIGKITTAGTVTEYSVTSADSIPHSITAVGDDLWFTEFADNKLAKITTSGTVTEYSVPTRKSLPYGVTAGPSSMVWFTELAPRKAAKFDPATTTFTEYTLPGGGSGTTDNRKMSLPGAITVGPDDNLWFTARALNKIGKITTSGTVTLYPITTSDAVPAGVAAKSGGDVWFTEGAKGKIAKSTTSGTITEYAIPTAAGFPAGIVEGPDGAMWFVEHAASKLGRITTSGTVTEHDLISTGSPLPRLPLDIVVGPDGNLWYTAYARGVVGKVIIAAGVVVDVVEYPVSPRRPAELISGGAGSGVLWYTLASVSKLGKITTGGVVTEHTVPVPGNGLTLGPDSNIWYTAPLHGKVVKFVPGTTPTTTEYTLSTGATPGGIVTGPDGNLWLTDFARGLIIKMTTSGTTTEYHVTDD